MKKNVQKSVFTHEGHKTNDVPSYKKLRRLVMSCMLWEDNFYVDGKTVADQIADVCKELNQLQVLNLALEVNQLGLLRHVPLWLIIHSFKCKNRMKCEKVLGQELESPAHYIEKICNRPDQMTELLSLYWKDGKKPIAAQIKKGLAHAFRKFDEHQLSKYNRDEPIKLRDILFLCHAKPKNKEQETLWKKLINDELKIADTWETRLSSGADKKESFQELLEKNKMGKLAIIRNLRNMKESGILKSLVREKLLSNNRPLLPFQFIAAAKEVPDWEDVIDESMIQSCKEKQKLKGKTCILVDVSGSMKDLLNAKSKLNRMDAACGLAILLREICEDCAIATFSTQFRGVPNRRGMSLRDAIITSQNHSSTMLGQALCYLYSLNEKFDRLIVITDEQIAGVMPKPKYEKNYSINLGCYKNGIKNQPNWISIEGFSESSIDYIIEIEKEEN